MIRITDKHACCGCAACCGRCPKQCITMREDDEGFLYPTVDESLCIGCGLCERVCPVMNPLQPLSPRQVLAAKNIDTRERLSSSSGGIFIGLAREVLRQGGVVFGAVYDEKWQAVVTYTETVDGVRPMMGSKYMQARVATAYCDCEIFLKRGRLVLFTGSPCQIAGLRTFLRGKSYERLIAVDFLCHGAPSPGVWRRYLRETLRDKAVAGTTETKHSVRLPSISVSSIEGIEFRNKDYGWKKYSLVVRLKSASGHGQDAVLLSDIYHDNAYMRGFLSDIYLRPSCYGCVFKNGRSHSDITIGDFWGIDRVISDFDDDKGVSIVIVNTDKGEHLFRRVATETRPASVADASPCNGGFNEHLRPHRGRNEFFRRYRSGNESVETIVNSLLHVSFPRRVLRKMKRMLRRFMP